MATFSWNSRLNPVTHRSPFKVAHGRQPRMGMEPTRQSSDDQIQSANDMVDKMKRVKDETEAALKTTAEDMKRFYDAGRRPENFKVGDMVWLDAQNLATERPSKKLDWKRLGPFQIEKKISNLAYQLRLPRHFQIHPVISVARLEHAKDNEWNRPRGRVHLKVRDPTTGEMVNWIRKPRVFVISKEGMEQIPWRQIL